MSIVPRSPNGLGNEANSRLPSGSGPYSAEPNHAAELMHLPFGLEVAESNHCVLCGAPDRIQLTLCPNLWKRKSTVAIFILKDKFTHNVREIPVDHLNSWHPRPVYSTTVGDDIGVVT